ncbi:MAG: hypothetical protein H0X13_07590 [Ramlibacter sp.]|nr:hypothetical protein [Ramlibacter sp.]
MARSHGFALVRLGYEKLEPAPSCGTDSQHALRGVEAEFARTVAAWLDGGAAPAEIGSTPARTAWDEQVLHYQVAGILGGTRLEMTLLLPEGRRPAPVVICNHGDIELDHPALRHKRRIRDMSVAREFLRLGVAVAMPARRGVAFSEGTYPKSFRAVDADATYKARVHAQDILPALDALRGRPEIDAERILLAGHSAGGYSASYLASTGPKGVIGAVNFAGGRTDSTAASGPGYLNKMMVDGFSEFGRGAKLPALFVFAEGDSRYSVQTIRASHEAFVAAGGQGQLVLAPPLGRDGHQVHLVPEHWRGALKSYLSLVGAVHASP